MKLGYVILYVDNVVSTVEFYERAFNLKRRMLDDEHNYGEIETGSTRLAFAARAFASQMLPIELAQMGPTKAAPPVELGFIAADVAAAFRRAVAAGAVEIKPPETKPWGQTVGYVRDLNGFLVEICSEMP
jgi:lactoylglutathione lyase